MSGSAPRRILKSVVRPALGTTLAALLAIAGCDQPPATATPDKETKPAPKPAESSSTQTSASATVGEVVDAGGAPDIPEPGLQPNIPQPGKMAPPPKVGTTAMPKVGKVPKPGIKSPSGPTVGLKLQLDDHTDGRPTRPTRRATDATYQAMIGSGPRRLA